MNVIDGWNTLQKYFKQAVVNPYFNYVECNLIYSVKYDKFYCNLDVKLKLKKYEILCGVFSNRITLSSLVVILNEIKYKYSLYNTSELTPQAFKWTCNGAGAKGWGFIVPDLKYTTCANIHDLMYTIGGNSSDRKWADDVFLWNMQRKTGGFIPYLYYYAVRMFGKNAFEFREVKLTIKQLNDSFNKEKN